MVVDSGQLYLTITSNSAQQLSASENCNMELLSISELVGGSNTGVKAYTCENWEMSFHAVSACIYMFSLLYTWKTATVSIDGSATNDGLLL